MKLNKESWKTVSFGEVVTHIEENERDLEKRKSARYVSVEHIETGNFKIDSWVEEEMPTFFRKFRKGQILFGKRRAYQRKVAVADFDGICSPHIWALESIDGLKQEFLPYVMLIEKFYEYVNAHSAGTMSPYINWRDIAQYKFLLPPKDEQEELLSIFKTLEKLIEQVEAQEKKLLELKTQLLQELFSGKRQFGTYLTDADFESVKFEQITFNISERVEPQETNYTIYVGLEHLDPDNLKIERKGKPKDVIGTKLKIYEGDIIFGKRRAYQRKVAVSDFEGIVSAHSMVLRANKKAIEKDLLPFFMQSDVFMNRAVQISEGSLSPTIKWKVLANQEFVIPKREKQKQIAETFIHFDKVIAEIRQQKKNLKNLKFKLLNEILG
jgi:restriction endonuclease S subunit